MSAGVSGGSVASVPIHGGAPNAFSTYPIPAVGPAIAIDSTNVYWFDYGVYGGEASATILVMRAPIGGGIGSGSGGGVGVGHGPGVGAGSGVEPGEPAAAAIAAELPNQELCPVGGHHDRAVGHAGHGHPGEGAVRRLPVELKRAAGTG